MSTAMLYLGRALADHLFDEAAEDDLEPRLLDARATPPTLFGIPFTVDSQLPPFAFVYRHAPGTAPPKDETVADITVRWTFASAQRIGDLLAYLAELNLLKVRG